MKINVIDMDERPVQSAKYLMYSLPHDEAIAVQNFKQRFGYQPKEIFNWFDKYLLIGPVEDENE